MAESRPLVTGFFYFICFISCLKDCFIGIFRKVLIGDLVNLEQ